MSEKEIMVSVGIPNYNSEKYIIKLLDSIRNQTYKNFEIVISDDCSIDNSLNLIYEYKEKFPELNFNIIKQKNNVGLIENRNIVLKECKGKYITFIDSDDYFEIECLEELVNEANKIDADMIIGAFRTVNENGKILQEQYLPEKRSKFMCGCHHGRLYKKKIFEDNQIRFIDCGSIEDFYMTAVFASYSKKVGFVNKILYNWVIREKSTSASKKEIDAFNNVEVLKILLDNIKDIYKRIENEEEKLVFEYHVIKIYYSVLYHNYRYAGIKEKLNAYKRMQDLMLDFNPDYRKNPLIKWSYATPVRKYAKIIIWLSMLLERTHLMPIALIGYHLISKIYYFDL